MKSFLFFLIAPLLTACGNDHATDTPVTCDELAIEVRDSSREIAYTNKIAGVLYTETNDVHRNAWQGWRIMSNEILDDYEIRISGEPLRRRAALRTLVLPHQFLRMYPGGLSERITLLDTLNALIIEIDGIPQRPITVHPLFSDSRSADDFVTTYDHGVLLIGHKHHLRRTVAEDHPAWIGITARLDNLKAVGGLSDSLNRENYGPSGVGGTPGHYPPVIVLAVGDTPEQTHILCREVLTSYEEKIRQRKERIEGILNRAYFRTDDPRLDKAMHWAIVSMDALIMHQQKKGIFAGLPWFDNYWGRDSFIALPGATLVTGNAAEAKEILRSFAEWQEQDSNSSNYGRIPNLVTTTSIAYNTADGTPWFVIGLGKYFDATADTPFIGELYPIVRRSIEGTLRYHVDEHGFLTHGDGETWMDAVGPEGPWSPRGNRAVEIQALWDRQLRAGIRFAGLTGDWDAVRRWNDAEHRLRSAFQDFFIDSLTMLGYDHLNEDGSPDRKLRPNQLFALDLVRDEHVRTTIFRTVTEQLVYSHGIASLSQNDSDFHPYHHYPPYYVQDAAYHNGIVWTWLAGVWISEAASAGVPDLALLVTEDMVDQIIDRGAVGTISELLDAAPRTGETKPRLSGTYSQAWSLAEFIRAMIEGYPGIHVDAPASRLKIFPSLPSSIGLIRSRIWMGASPLDLTCERRHDNLMITLTSAERARQVIVDVTRPRIFGTPLTWSFPLGPSETLRFEIGTRGLEVMRNGQQENVPEPLVMETADPSQFRNLRLALPTVRPDLPALRGPAHPMLTLDDIKVLHAGADTVLDADDPPGDDIGTGAYRYPLTTHLRPGSLDLLRYTVSTGSDRVHFRLLFRALSNPGWHPEYGFQLTFAVIVIDTDGIAGSGAVRVGMNANYVFREGFAFDRIIAVGGGLRVMNTAGAILGEYIPLPGDERNPLGNAADASISFSLPTSLLGTPSPRWKMAVLVGCQDDHGGAGIGEFRTVDATAKEWIGGGKARPSDPNVYDLLPPE